MKNEVEMRHILLSMSLGPSGEYRDIIIDNHWREAGILLHDKPVMAVVYPVEHAASEERMLRGLREVEWGNER